MRLIKLLIVLLCLINHNIVYGEELIVVGAEWCHFCVQLKEYIKKNPKIIEKYNKVQYIDIDEHPEIIQELNTTTYPTSFIFRKNKLISKKQGFSPNSYIEWLKKNE